MTYWPIAALLFVASLGSACSDAHEGKNNRFALASSLKEISGLAAASDTSVFAHDDEHAIIHEIGISNGKTLRSFALGEPSVKGDFEGIATANGSIYLVTSDGLIYAARIGENEQRMDYRIYDTGIGVRCEIEGLSRAPLPNHLLVLCKRPRPDKKHARLKVYRWKIGNEHSETEPWLSVSLDDMLKKREITKFAPSAIEWDPSSKRFFIASARSRQVLILDETGKLLDKRKLDRKLHQQTEGLTIVADGRLVLADEGSGGRKAYLTTYRER